MDEEELIIDDERCGCPSCAAIATDDPADCDCEGLTCLKCGSCVKHCKCPGGPARK